MKRLQKFETISHLIWNLLSKRQINGEIISKFVAFSENLNFKPVAMCLCHDVTFKKFWWLLMPVLRHEYWLLAVLLSNNFLIHRVKLKIGWITDLNTKCIVKYHGSYIVVLGQTSGTYLRFFGYFQLRNRLSQVLPYCLKVS